MLRSHMYPGIGTVDQDNTEAVQSPLGEGNDFDSPISSASGG